MTDQEINIAIAEAVKWKPSVDSGICWDDNGKPIVSPPSYTTDLNAMHEAEVVMGDEDYFNYCRIALPKAQQSEIAQGRTATASQRAEAFLRTLGKWMD